jgi:hypothetical protein
MRRKESNTSYQNKMPSSSNIPFSKTKWTLKKRKEQKYIEERNKNYCAMTSEQQELALSKAYTAAKISHRGRIATEEKRKQRIEESRKKLDKIYKKYRDKWEKIDEPVYIR